MKKNTPIKEKNKGGRPTKFKPHYTESLVKFFDIEPYQKVTTKRSTEMFKDGGVRKESEEFKLIPNKMPTLYRFSRKIGVAYSTVWRWAERGTDADVEKKLDEAINKGETNSEDVALLKNLQMFCNAYKEAKELQKEFLINIGLAGAAPAPFAIFTAKNVTDMRDKVETDITSKGEQIGTVTSESLALAKEYEERIKKGL